MRKTETKIILLKFENFNNNKATKILSDKIKSCLKYKNTGELYLIYPPNFDSINSEIENFNKATKINIFSIVSKLKLIRNETYNLLNYSYNPYPEFLE